MPTTLLSERFARTVLLLLALIPLLLFAYLGSHARMMADDYCHLRVSKDLGLLPSVAFWRSGWSGGYTYYLVFGLLAPLGVAGPAVFPAFIIGVWLAALAALIFQACALAGLSHFPRLTAVTAAAIIIALSVWRVLVAPVAIFLRRGRETHSSDRGANRLLCIVLTALQTAGFSNISCPSAGGRGRRYMLL